MTEVIIAMEIKNKMTDLFFNLGLISFQTSHMPFSEVKVFILAQDMDLGCGLQVFY
jgi:hypothetical protein